jgi:dienelactone hydrolase
MGIFIFFTAVLVEVVFAAYCIITKSNQKRIRSIIRITAFVGFAILALLPIVDWGLRYYPLAALLLLMAVMGAVDIIRKREEKREYKAVRVVLRAVGMILLIFVVDLPAILFPQHKKIEVTGKYEVATSAYTYTDKSRVETYTSTGENRKLNVQVWYPEDGEGKYPLIVFSHGSFGIKSSNESLYNELASHGYVVCSIDHTYQCFYTTDMDRQTVYMDKGYMQEVREENPKVDIQKSYKYYQKWMNIRTGDINYVLDYILLEVKNNTADKVYKLVDAEKIGVMGHSLGGSAALGIGRMRKDVSAVIALEAPFMYDIKGVRDGKFIFTDERYPVPVLNVYSDASYSHLGEWVQYAENYALLSNTNAAAFNVYINGAGHLGLTDFSLTSPILQRMIDKASGAKSTIDSVSCLKTINKLSLEFFDCYLKGQGKFVSQGTY